MSQLWSPVAMFSDRCSGTQRRKKPKGCWPALSKYSLASSSYSSLMRGWAESFLSRIKKNSKTSLQLVGPRQEGIGNRHHCIILQLWLPSWCWEWDTDLKQLRGRKDLFDLYIQVILHYWGTLGKKVRQESGGSNHEGACWLTLAYSWAPARLVFLYSPVPPACGWYCLEWASPDS